ncbi:hypothetical protein SAMN04489727_9155 [Amycolatopsis tolypomycina]|uniref:Uncharacterized protein n=1 Tax=Amycolatopsis tolypomycina TaxID=208445 RepID=A0A1H5D4N3_9PSEU|nr:hypothetical protein [Amycolatopsis tolypomycina]SED73837.1 hypothetical protein SAMN04489727_9155 [Amycolatopsis tolypomycina]
MDKGLAPLRLILAFSLLSTTIHYAHNTVRYADYPQLQGISVLAGGIVVAVTWVLLTAFGWLGYRAYTQGRYHRALAFLLVYSLAGLVTLGHFLTGVPQIPAFWFATIFTDAAAGLALWAFVFRSWATLNRVTTRDQVSTQH